MAAGYLALVDREFLVRAAVENSAHTFDGGRDIPGGGPLGRAAETQMLDKMGDAGLRVFFITGAGADEKTN